MSNGIRELRNHRLRVHASFLLKACIKCYQPSIADAALGTKGGKQTVTLQRSKCRKWLRHSVAMPNMTGGGPWQVAIASKAKLAQGRVGAVQ
jgi:hypothetical protein